MCSDAERSAFVGGPNEAKEELGADVVERSKADLVHDHEVEAQQP
jgi:hypothetical protein